MDEFQDFLCLDIDKVVKIKIPKVCCGITINIAKSYHSSSKAKLNYLDSMCILHMRTYDHIMNTYKDKWSKVCNKNDVTGKQINIHKCVSCKEENQFAEANMSDGSYKCYQCRNK